ncbi:MAG: hypothetical protein EXS18_03940 [Verrucomicrobiae bacterium]|nr:hypothetical protein [Verrucomicrobiae bacterium]
MINQCPNCGLINPADAERCDCGHSFETCRVGATFGLHPSALTNPVQNTPVRVLTAFLASAGLTLVLSYVLAVVACYFGVLFSGTDSLFAVLVATVFCAIVAPVTALVFKRKGKRFTWPTLFIEVMLLTLVAIGLLSWLQTREKLKTFMDPVPVPSGVHVHNGRGVLFAAYVHFTAPPVVIAAVIKSKELVEVSAEVPDQADFSGYSERQRTKVPWDWWQPATMFNPRFFYRHHESEAVQGWSEGWWVNGATNEVYARIGG